MRNFQVIEMKTTIDELAIFGGLPEFTQPVHVGRPNTGNREAFLARINQVLDAGYLTNNGPRVLELEQRLSDLLRVKHVVAVCNGTLALELLIRAMGLAGEVILPSLTFVATAHALSMLGITPVFCDVDPVTHNLDPQQVERSITPQTTAILGVHLWGRACEVEELEALSRRHKLALIYDAAHAFSCSQNGRMIGNFGNAEIFSFHATKFFHTLEGGAVTTADTQLADRIRLLRNFGFAGLDHVVSIGTNAKMNEISAAMGLTLLDDLNSITETNFKNYNLYTNLLENLPGVCLVSYNPNEHNNYQYIVLEIDAEKAGLSRDQMNDILWAENIRARRYFFPGVHRMEPYRSTLPAYSNQLPVTERLVHRLMALPNGTSIREMEIEAICNIIRLCLRNAVEIKRRLSVQESQGKKSHPGQGIEA